MTTETPWTAVYSRYFNIESDLFETEEEGLQFLHYGSDQNELSVISLHGPGGKKWNRDQISEHFQDIWDAEHADEIAEQKAKAEADRVKHEAWLAEQPPWKRDYCSEVKAMTEDGHLHLALDGVELPFRVRKHQFVRNASEMLELVLTIPLHTRVQVLTPATDTAVW